MGQRGRPKKEKPDMSNFSEENAPTFAEAKGTEANQHAKKLAKEKSKKTEKQSDTYYTLNGSKVLSLKVNENGIFKEYVGNLSKKSEASALKSSIDLWKKNQKWVEPHALKEFCKSLVSK